MTTKQKKKSKTRPKTQKPNVPAKTVKQPEPAAMRSNKLSRNELMLEAKARGIKNFRVTNKQELAEILADGTTQERINEIIAGAVARWKNGWGTGKSREKTQA